MLLLFGFVLCPIVVLVWWEVFGVCLQPSPSRLDEVCWGGIKSASRLASVCLKSAMELHCFFMFFSRQETPELLDSKQ